MEYEDINPHEILRFEFTGDNQNYMVEPEYNMHFLHIQISILNDLFRAQGYLFVNEVLRRMGFEVIPEGQLVGWTHDVSPYYPNIQVILEPLAVRLEPQGFIWNKIGEL